MSVTVYVEGGGDSAQLKGECRRSFRELLTRAGFTGRLPKIVPSGPRDRAFRNFQRALRSDDYPILLVDSEEPVAPVNQPSNQSGAWEHLAQRDNWQRPNGAQDDQAQLMVTVMETWLVADRSSLATHFHMNASAFLPDADLESRHRQDVLDSLHNATDNRYRKGSVSFEVLSKVNPAVLRAKLPHFQRFIDALDAHA